MVWEKLGLVYVASGDSAWARSHAAIPTPYMPDAETIRLYVAFLDERSIGRVGYVDVAASDPRRILKVSHNPVLDIGQAGTFDEQGVTPIAIVPHEDRLYLYYVGWQLGVNVRYFLFMGLAVSDDDGEHFVRYSKTPILDRSDDELFIRTAGFVVHDHGKWKMWYAGGGDWIEVNGKSLPSYSLRYLESTNGVAWGRHGRVCIKPSGDEFGFGRPFVINEDGRYRMWYSIRSKSKGYRLGYAESIDAIEWIRDDNNVGIDVARQGWDSEMICYSAIQKTKYGTYMFYNGNNYGATGFGVAVLR